MVDTLVVGSYFGVCPVASASEGCFINYYTREVVKPGGQLMNVVPKWQVEH